MQSRRYKDADLAVLVAGRPIQLKSGRKKAEAQASATKPQRTSPT